MLGLIYYIMSGWITQCESKWTRTSETEQRQYLSKYFTYQRLIPDKALDVIIKFRLKFKLKQPC